ncbi:unnamed protein product [Sphagnum troendelagicum]|uniref:Laccase n=1 Tax=Sphagnum troendelagicum TaxID=128251 RepID=A0ABP0TNK5_9BRYO
MGDGGKLLLACFLRSQIKDTCFLCQMQYKLQFHVDYANVTRLNHTKSMMLVNSQFPGPPITAHEGDTIVVKVTSLVQPNITIHWHGVKQLQTGWYDGVPYVTQCPLKQGDSYTYRFQLLNQTGTLWYHAHTSWHRASIHGAIIIYPHKDRGYPFPTPNREVPIILGGWWNADVEDVIEAALATGGGYSIPDALTINGQPGYLYNYSSSDATRLRIRQGESYQLRVVNACLNFAMYFAVANHSLTVRELDSAYCVPFTVDVLLIAPGQTVDCILNANLSEGQFYMAASVFSLPDPLIVPFPQTPATAFVEYEGSSRTHPVYMPTFPAHNDSSYRDFWDSQERSLNTSDQTLYVPQTIDRELFFTVGYGLSSNSSCSPLPNCTAGFKGYRILGAVNNITFVTPSSSDTSLLRYAYLYDRGVSTSNSNFDLSFPDDPKSTFNYTGPQPPLSTRFPEHATRLSHIDYNSNVQLVLQDTSILLFETHPFHLHGFSFHIVGRGYGNYDPATSPATFNLVNPPYRNTFGVNYGGWIAIRFQADNPGAWLFHCHIELHASWGMETVFFVHEGNASNQRLQSPPMDYPVC